MGDHKRRISKLEEQAGVGDKLPFLVLKQDFNDRDLYHSPDGAEYRRPFDSFEGKYNLIVVEYEHNWRGDGIKLKWPEDD